MINRRRPRWRACVALVAAYALVLSALLSSLAPLAQGRANPHGVLSIAICLSSGNTATPDKAPVAPTDHRHDACCMLCMIPGLAATSDEVRFQSAGISIVAFISADTVDGGELTRCG